MPQFSPPIQAFWAAHFLTGDRLSPGEDFTITVNPRLATDRQLMILSRSDGRVHATLRPELADRLGLKRQPCLSEALLRQRLREHQLQLHGADRVFHFSEDDQVGLLQEAPPPGLRPLQAADAPAFAVFQAAASEQDLDDAFVELDHCLVWGAFEGERLVCAASMYPWADDGQTPARLADVGVLTLPDQRGRGHARRVVRAIARHAFERGHEMQYRCQIDNTPSAALARSAGLHEFGRWEVLSAGQS